ncbi:MAG: hypothetical protein AAFR96_03395 [Planctomycetota bacterium]
MTTGGGQGWTPHQASDGAGDGSGDWTGGRTGDWERDASRNESLELPLDMFFAEDHGAPEAVAKRLELSDRVLGRVDAERGFVSRPQRRMLTAGRVTLGAVAASVLLGVALADRLGFAPWRSEISRLGPVSGLVASASEDTSERVERAMELRDAILAVAAVPDPAGVGLADGGLDLQTRVTQTEASSVDGAFHGGPVAVRVAAGSFEAGRQVQAGPYLTAHEPWDGSGDAGASTVVRFGDGLRVPMMASAGGARAELHWPDSASVTRAAISLDGMGTLQAPVRLVPAWYSERPR